LNRVAGASTPVPNHGGGVEIMVVFVSLGIVTTIFAC